MKMELKSLKAHIKRLVADKFVNLLAGKGYTLTSINKQINNFGTAWQVKGHFEELTHQIIHANSISGEVAVGIEGLNNDDEQMFLVARSDRGQVLAKSKRFNELVSITILKEVLTTSAKRFYLRETGTDASVERSGHSRSDDDYKISLPFSSIQLDLPPAYQVVRDGIYPNPYGFIPFELFSNYYHQPEPDINRAEWELTNYLDYKRYEQQEGRTGGTILLFNNLDQSTIQALRKQPDFSNVKRVLFGQQAKGGEGKSLEYVSPNYQIQAMIEMDRYYLTKIFQAVGLQFDTKIEHATATEASLNHSTQGATIALKRQAFNDAMNRLLLKLFKFKFGINDPAQFEFKLNENSAISTRELTDQIKTELDAGLTSRQRAIVRLTGGNETDAEQLLQEIDNERKGTLELMNKHYPPAEADKRPIAGNEEPNVNNLPNQGVKRAE